MKIAFHTLGCKVNQYETEVMREAFVSRGHTIVSDNSPFDAVVINSCTVTAQSDRKTRQILRHFRKENPQAAVVLTGCMVQAFSDEAKELCEADVIVGNTDVLKVVDFTEEFFKTGEKIFFVGKHTLGERFNTPNITSFAERTRAYIKIEDGCERYCTYCIIPSARGVVRSKSIEDIKLEAQTLADNGFKEIVLVGINLSAYGKGTDYNLCDAVDAVSLPNQIKRVRLGSLEPDHISDDMLSRLKAQAKFCPQFHLSLQSGCDATLKRMNRHYDSAFYYDLVCRIRKTFENPSITTDIMVGFAGETETEFNQSLDFAKKVGFAKSHIFAYSRRKGTMAYNMPNQVSKVEKIQRSKKMIDATLETEEKFLLSQIGLTCPVLFETFCNGFAEGYTPNYSKIKVKSDCDLNGKILNVKITIGQKDFCLGVLV